MKYSNSFKITIVALLLFAIISMAFKVHPVIASYDDFLPKEAYVVTYDYFFKAKDKAAFVKTYIPESNHRQKISQLQQESTGMSFVEEQQDENVRGIWRSTTAQRFNTISLSFIFKGKAIKYELADDLMPKTSYAIDQKYLLPEKYIQADHEKITALQKRLTANEKDIKSIVTRLFDYVHNIPKAPIRDLTDALTALEQNQASCNGKARLFVALCRNYGLPARLRGGLILEETKKRTSHLWTEVYIKGQWIPFDVLNDHFAYLPANYLEIYIGDHFLITHTPKILFDYHYVLKKANNIPFINLTTNETLSKNPISLWKLSESEIMSKDVLSFFLLLPLAGLLIALFKNVVGLKTFGVFLPILIAFTLVPTGYFVGIFLFLLILSLVALLSRFLNTFQLLYTPKVVVILTFVIAFMLITISVGLAYNIDFLMALTLFPIIIVSIASERFARAIEEDGFYDAAIKLLQTLVVTSLCYFVFASEVIHTLFILFPELILIIIAITLLLGKWIGLRVSEYKRFRLILN